MTRFVKRLAWIGAVSVLVAGLPAMDVAQAASQPAGPGAGTPHVSGLAGGRQGFLYGVSFRSATSGWAVGLSCAPNCQRGAQDTLIQHWTGTSWSRVASPSPSPIEGLFSVSDVSARDAWAVGSYGTRDDGFDTLILHWNGARWSKVASPDPGKAPYGLHVLNAVTGVSARNAWAVGYYCLRHCQGDGEVDATLILHWNGRRWSTIASPAPSASHSILSGVAAVSARNAWAAGTYTTRAGNIDTLILHWNGVTWSRVASPDPHPGDNQLLGVTAVSARNAWAAGSFCVRRCQQSGEVDHTLILHWNGASWSRVASPGAGTGAGGVDVLSGVTGGSARNAWAVGYSCAKRCEPVSAGAADGRTLILHWNGARWSRVASPNPGQGENNLSGTSAISATGAWAVGTTCTTSCGNGTVFHPLILRWTGARWSTG